jgi:hypothetical protein
VVVSYFLANEEKAKRLMLLFQSAFMTRRASVLHTRLRFCALNYLYGISSCDSALCIERDYHQFYFMSLFSTESGVSTAQCNGNFRFATVTKSAVVRLREFFLRTFAITNVLSYIFICTPRLCNKGLLEP